MYAYCTEVLHLSEGEAYLRIAAARASREHPVLLEMLADGRLHLSAIAKLAPHLTAENRDELLKRAVHKSNRQVEELLAELAPRPDVRCSMRKLPERRALAELELRPGKDASIGSGGLAASEAVATFAGAPRADDDHPDRPAAAGNSQPATIELLAPARYRVQFTASAELRDKLERLRALMRPSVPDGDLAAIVEAAVTEKLERLESRRFGRSRLRRKVVVRTTVSGTADPASGAQPTTAVRSSPGEGGSASTRHVPAAVKRAVYERDGGRCRYVDAQGRRCTAREGLEFHHRRPFGHGGGHSVENIALACKAHNGYLAEVDYGRKAMARRRRRRQGLLELAPPSP